MVTIPKHSPSNSQANRSHSESGKMFELKIINSNENSSRESSDSNHPILSVLSVEKLGSKSVSPRLTQVTTSAKEIRPNSEPTPCLYKNYSDPKVLDFSPQISPATLLAAPSTVSSSCNLKNTDILQCNTQQDTFDEVTNDVLLIKTSEQNNTDQNQNPIPLDLRHKYSSRKSEEHEDRSDNNQEDIKVSSQTPPVGQHRLPYHHIPAYNVEAQMLNRYTKLSMRRDSVKLGPQPVLQTMVRVSTLN